MLYQVQELQQVLVFIGDCQHGVVTLQRALHQHVAHGRARRTEKP